MENHKKAILTSLFTFQEVSRQSSSTVISKSDVVRIHVPYQPDDIVTVSNSSANVVESPHDSRSRGGAESR